MRGATHRRALVVVLVAAAVTSGCGSKQLGGDEKAAAICDRAHRHLEPLPGLLTVSDVLVSAPRISHETLAAAGQLRDLHRQSGHRHARARYADLLERQAHLVDAMYRAARRRDQPTVTGLAADVQANARAAQQTGARIDPACGSVSHRRATESGPSV